MVSITIYKNHNEYSGFECAGHAGYSEYGSDIVCSALSMLVINTINSIDQFTTCNMKVQSNEDNGLIRVNFDSKVEQDVKLLLDSMILGISSVKEQYGSKYVKLKFKEG